MPDTESSKTAKSKRSSLVKLFSIVIALLTAGFVFLYFAINSNSFSNKLIRYSIAGINPHEGLSCKIATITGTIYKGIQISEINVKSTKRNCSINIHDINLSFSFATMGRGKKVEVAVVCDKIDANGFRQFDFLSKIPKVPANSCFSGAKIPILLKSFKIKNLSASPFKENQLNVNVKDICIEPPAPGDSFQKSSMSFSSLLNNSELLCGSFTGKLSNHQRKLSGTLSTKFLGQNLNCQVDLQEKRHSIKASGSFASSTINLAKFSQWLIPLWQDNFPFGFDGYISFKGTWAYDKSVGLLSNLTGSIKDIRLVALGFYYPLFMLNANWTLFNNSLLFKDSGSTVSGFKSNISGKIDDFFSKKPNWNLNFICSTIDAKKYINNLPWGLKYGLGLPPMNGSMSFKLAIRGTKPDINAELKTKGLAFGKSLEKELTGSMKYASSAKKANFWSIKYHLTSQNNATTFFDKFVYKHIPISSVLAKSKLFSMDSNISGKTFLDLSFKGKLKIDDDIYNGAGKWLENSSHVSFISPDKSKIYTATNIILLDFLFAR